TIEVVIDRFKVRNDLSQRLAESFETALELSGGTAVVADMDDERGTYIMDDVFGILPSWMFTAIVAVIVLLIIGIIFARLYRRAS
ncbi:hypothetical protein MJL27_26305, partial [Salmonella enterica subsp. enterica serovar Anatum]|nr:hypothetical protein [Salmonella enterica subsp. enterica serovar Anatum]